MVYAVGGLARPFADPGRQRRTGGGGEANRYWHPTGEDEARFAWADEDYARIAYFNATPGE